MTSPFDFESPKAKKASVAKTEPAAAPASSSDVGSKLKAALLDSKGETQAMAEKVTEDSAPVAEPKITSRLHSALASIINKQHLIKRSQMVSRVVKDVFPNLDDMTDDESNAVYGTVNMVIDQMISEGDMRELKFITEEGRVVDSVIYSSSLNPTGLPADDEIELDLPETSDNDILDLAPGSTTQEEEDELNSIAEISVHGEEAHALLAEHIEGFAVTHNVDGKRTMVPFDNPLGAQSYAMRTSEKMGADTQLWGMIPLTIEVQFGFGTISDDIVPPVLAEAPVASVSDEDIELPSDLDSESSTSVDTSADSPAAPQTAQT